VMTASVAIVAHVVVISPAALIALANKPA
jgi:hypothetical protein